MAYYPCDDTKLVPGLDDEDIARLDIPILVFRSGSTDINHPRSTSERLAANLPGAVLVEPPWGDNEWNDRSADQASPRFVRWPLLAPTDRLVERAPRGLRGHGIGAATLTHGGEPAAPGGTKSEPVSRPIGILVCHGHGSESCPAERFTNHVVGEEILPVALAECVTVAQPGDPNAGVDRPGLRVDHVVDPEAMTFLFTNDVGVAPRTPSWRRCRCRTRASRRAEVVWQRPAKWSEAPRQSSS